MVYVRGVLCWSSCAIGPGSQALMPKKSRKCPKKAGQAEYSVSGLGVSNSGCQCWLCVISWLVCGEGQGKEMASATSFNPEKRFYACFCRGRTPRIVNKYSWIHTICIWVAFLPEEVQCTLGSIPGRPVEFLNSKLWT